MRKGSEKREKEHCSNQNCICTQLLLIYIKETSLDYKSIHISIYHLCLIVI